MLLIKVSTVLQLMVILRLMIPVFLSQQVRQKNKCINDEATTEYKLIESEVVNIFCELAQAIIRDGEGRNKVFDYRSEERKKRKRMFGSCL